MGSSNQTHDQGRRIGQRARTRNYQQECRTIKPICGRTEVSGVDSVTAVNFLGDDTYKTSANKFIGLGFKTPITMSKSKSTKQIVVEQYQKTF